MGRLIRGLAEAEINEAAALLASAFFERPFYRYLAPDDDERREFLAVNFDMRLREGFGVNDIRTVRKDEGGAMIGIAVWVPPSATPGDKRLADAAFARFSAPLRERFFRFLDILHRARDEAVQGSPVWSLAPIAVLQSERGSGAGGALLRSKLHELDEQKALLFLGTQDEENTALYRHFGFTIARKDPLPGSELIHYTMLRQTV